MVVTDIQFEASRFDVGWSFVILMGDIEGRSPIHARPFKTPEDALWAGKRWADKVVGHLAELSFTHFDKWVWEWWLPSLGRTSLIVAEPRPCGYLSRAEAHRAALRYGKQLSLEENRCIG